jgi:hypothetical protein
MPTCEWQPPPVHAGVKIDAWMPESVATAVPQEHALATHTLPPVHLFPHVPQWSAFVAVSTQTPEQSVFGQVAEHVPFTQNFSDAPQTFPQEPQFVGSVFVLRQASPHEVSSRPHERGVPPSPPEPGGSAEIQSVMHAMSPGSIALADGIRPPHAGVAFVSFSTK